MQICSVWVGHRQRARQRGGGHKRIQTLKHTCIVFCILEMAVGWQFEKVRV